MKTKIKFLSFSLAILLAFTSLPVTISAESQSGEILRDLGILKGDMDGDLLLDQPLKRQDIIVLLSRLLGEEETAENYPGKPSFTDITDPYYIPFISWAEDSGLTEGTGNGLFGYNEFLTNQQLMAFLLRSLGYEYYGEDYGMVPIKSVELDLSPSEEAWAEVTTRQIMADRTVTLLRQGRVKYSNITLKKGLALKDTDVPDNGQLFIMTEAEIRNGILVSSFRASSAQDYNSSRSNKYSTMIDDGPDIDDLYVTIRIDDGSAFVLELEKQFYDSATGLLMTTFEHPDISDDSTVEVMINYLENRELVAHEAAHVVQQKASRTYEPGELLLIFEDLLGDLLQTGTGVFSGSAFNDDEMNQVTGLQTNPYFADNSLSGEMALLENGASISGGSNVVTMLDGISEFIPENFITIILQDGETVDCSDCVSILVEGKTITTEISNIAVPKTGTVEILHAYANTENLEEKYSQKYGLSKEETLSIIEELIVNLHKASKPGTITSTYHFGLLTIHKERIDFKASELRRLDAVIVGNERTNPKLGGDIIVLVPGRAGLYELRTYNVIDHGNNFRNDEDAYNYFSRYLDPDDDGDGVDTLFIDTDSDGDGFGDIVFTKDKKPASIVKRLDKTTPLLFTADGGLGDHVTLYMKNGKVMFWSNDCDDSESEIVPTVTYVDSIEMSINKRSARTGRNPQTGKEIKISAKTPIVIDHEDGSVTVSNLDNPDALLLSQTEFPYARIVADNDDNALFIHIIQDAVVVYVKAKELDKSSPKIMYTNTFDLTDEEMEFLLSDLHEIELFVFRQEFGPVNGFSARVHSNGRFVEFIEYSTKAGAASSEPRFKAGAELSKLVNKSAEGGAEASCNSVLVGNPPEMEGLVELGEISADTKAILIVDSFFDIFMEVSPEFRGHVTVLK